MKNLKYLFLLMILPMVGIVSACTDQTPEDNTQGMPTITLSPSPLEYSYLGGEKTVQITTNFETTDIKCTVGVTAMSWCTAVVDGKTIRVTLTSNSGATSRSTTLTVSSGKTKAAPLEITQSGVSITGDLKVRVSGGKATSEATGTGSNDMKFANSYDGILATFFNSQAGVSAPLPFMMEYYFENVESIDYLVHYPRQDAGNKWGAIGKLEVWIATEANPTLTKYGDFDFGQKLSVPSRIDFPGSIIKPKTVRFMVQDCYENRVSAAEVEFYCKDPKAFDYLTIFTDGSCSQIKSSIDKAQIDAISDPFFKEIASSIFNNTYQSEYRIADYRPYQDPKIMALANKTSKYSKLDNITGMIATAGVDLVVFVGPTKGQKLSLVVQDLRDRGFGGMSYMLGEGMNVIRPSYSGLIYITNFTDDKIPLILRSSSEKAAAAAKTVRIHIATGQVNGYFDATKNKAEDWTKILANAKWHDMDIFGEYAHITWPVAEFRRDNTDAMAVVKNYDWLVYAQQDFMGLVKHNKMFNNRMYFAAGYNNAKSPNASDYRTIYAPHSSYAELFTKADRFDARLWGPSHEVGHCNQTRPGMKWAGLTEVTNNIHSLYIQQQRKQPCNLRNAYEPAFNGFLGQNKAHATAGLSISASTSQEWRLIPFWQLKLYLVDVLGQTDFYKDMYEHVRITQNFELGGLTEGLYQLDFVRQACRISGFNLSDYFYNWGFLSPVSATLNDYGDKKIIITEQQIDELKVEIEAMGLPKPPKDFSRITDTTLDSYK